jgi:hypothetical protein
MNDAKLIDWIGEQQMIGGKLVLLETFAGHAVVGILQSGRLLIALKREIAEKDFIIGVGVKLLGAGKNENSTSSVEENKSQTKESPPHFIVPLGGYRGTIEVFLRASKSPTRKFTVQI